MIIARPSNLQLTHSSNLLVSLNHDYKILILKNRYGENLRNPLDKNETISILSLMLSLNKFEGRNKLFQNQLQNELEKEIKKVMQKGISIE